MDSSASSGFQDNASTETPRLCTSGCGFFGSPNNGGLCSKCYADERKKNLADPGQATIIMANKLKRKISEESEQPSIKKTKSEPKTDDNWLELMGRLKEGSASPPAPDMAPKKKNRCGCCNKKVGLLGFTCRCGSTFCGTHRYAEAHKCTFDFKAAGKVMIEKQNPVVQADKLSNRA